MRGTFWSHEDLRDEGLEQIEDENCRLKQIVADREVDIQVLKHLAGGKLVSSSRKRDSGNVVEDEFETHLGKACDPLA